MTSGHIKRFLVAQQARDLSPYTIHAFARCVKTLCFFMLREGLIPTSPMARVKMPKLPQDLLPPFTTGEVRALLRACENERDTAIILTLLDSGVRASELCALDVADLDMTTGALTVYRGKGRKSRLTYCGARARQALLRYLNSRSNTLPTAPLFVTLRDGQRLQYDGLRALLRRISDRANVADVDAHRFRRTFAIESLRAGMPIMQLAAMMGHGSLPVLQRYLRLLSDDLAQAHREHGPVAAMLGKGGKHEK
jgi:site-specific recombinase XerD